MKPVNIVLIAGLLSIGGVWAEKKTIPTKQVVGAAVIAFAFVVLPDNKFSTDFAWLILAGAVGVYGQDLFGAIGNVTNAPPVGGAPTGQGPR